jgi:hypothetical protein
MIVDVLRAARRLDERLQQKLGRPYSALLGIGLVIEIIARVREMIELPETSTSVMRLCLTVVFFALLLVHQLGELSEHRKTPLVRGRKP